MTVKQLKYRLKEILAEIEDCEFETEQLLTHFLGCTPAQLLLNGERQIENTQEIIEAAKKRADRYPLQYILGEWEFYSLPFYLTEDTLIPRADTELLVDSALEYIGTKEGLNIIDLCSGSGCIAVSIAANTKNCNITAVEKYPDAAKVLKENVLRNKVEINLKIADVLTESFGSYDLIVSNPPYIKSEVIKGLQSEVLCEPRVALDGGNDGLMFYRAIIEKWVPLLKPNGAVVVEIGYDQADEVSQLFSTAGLENITVKKDINGNYRAIIGTAKTKTD